MKSVVRLAFGSEQRAVRGYDLLEYGDAKGAPEAISFEGGEKRVSFRPEHDYGVGGLN